MATIDLLELVSELNDELDENQIDESFVLETTGCDCSWVIKFLPMDLSSDDYIPGHVDKISVLRGLLSNVDREAKALDAISQMIERKIEDLRKEPK